MNYKSAKNQAYVLNSKLFRKLCFMLCFVPSRATFTCSKLYSATSHVFNHKRFEQVIPIHQNYSIDFRYIGKFYEKRAVLEKNELSWTSVPASRCTFQTTKSEMRPTFQNIDCFKDETSSLMLPTHGNIKQEQQQQICGRKGGRGWSARVANWNLTRWHRSGGWEPEDSPNKNIITQQQHNNQAKGRS